MHALYCLHNPPLLKSHRLNTNLDPNMHMSSDFLTLYFFIIAVATKQLFSLSATAISKQDNKKPKHLVYLAVFKITY